MIFISKFRSNDLNSSKGKQIEFNKKIVDAFFNFTNQEYLLEFECYSLSDSSIKENIKAKLKWSPSRGDYKIYQNDDGTNDLKDFFINILHLDIENNIDDYFAIKKKNDNNYVLYYIPHNTEFSNFYQIVNDQIIWNEPDDIKESSVMTESLQQIFYGAPGTGKSHTINDATKGEDVIRTTFHPDSDYSTFVGAYKPTTIEEPGITIVKKDGVSIIDTDRREYKETKIVYEFVPQAFLQAYIAAWKKYANSGNDEPRKQFLVIEEINRGNCAQIFGDLFQLLDRNDYGFSEYPIKTDADMKKQLQKEFKELDIPQRDDINAMFKEHYPDIVKEVLNGDLLLLPDNFYIWATMNTSDQSLFPIDSAFKRRWDWEYEPIKYENTDWVIDIQGGKYSWTSFQKEVNRRIFEATNSEDKQLGDYFVNPRDGVITEKVLVNKILFYLWNDVCKDGEGDIFKVSDTEDVSFSELYIDKGKLIKLMDYLHVEKSMKGNKDQASENEGESDEEGVTTPQSI